MKTYNRKLVDMPDEVVYVLCSERERAIRAAFDALNRAETTLLRLRDQLHLAEEGRPYRRVAGAGSAALSRNVDGINLGPIYAAFDAIERVAMLTDPKEEEETSNG